MNVGLPSGSVQIRRIIYSGESEPIAPVFYDDIADVNTNVLVLDTVLEYDPLIRIQGYYWNGIRNVPNPTGDLTGDELRAACLAYWKLDEISGTRIDSTTNGYNLVECADGNPSTPAPNPPVVGVTGKIGNAVKIFDNTNSISTLANNAASINENVLFITAWIKVNALTGGNPSASQNQSWDCVVLQTSSFDPLRAAVVCAREDNSMYVTAFNGSTSDSDCFNIVSDTWYFVVVEVNFDNLTVKLTVNNNDPIDIILSTSSLQIVANHLPFTLIQFASTNYMSDTDYMISDEIGIFAGSFNSTYRDYLYNSGNGRTLYP